MNPFKNLPDYPYNLQILIRGKIGLKIDHFCFISGRKVYKNKVFGVNLALYFISPKLRKRELEKITNYSHQV